VTPQGPAGSSEPEGADGEHLERLRRERLEMDDRVPRSEGDSLPEFDEQLSSSSVDDVLWRIDRELVGLAAVKLAVRDMARRLLADSMRSRSDSSVVRQAVFLTFSGPPGTGKSTVARRVAELLFRLRYSRKGHLVVANRDDLVSRTQGEGVAKVREVFKRAQGGTLLMDDGFLPWIGDPADYAVEAIGAIPQQMQINREEVAVVLCGDKPRLDEFFAKHPSLLARTTQKIEFPSYSVDELMQIAHLLAERLNYELSPAAGSVLEEFLAAGLREPEFAFARTVRDAIDRARLAQAERIYDLPVSTTAHDRRLIAEEDLRKGVAPLA